MSESVVGFSLTPQEDFVTGVRYEGERLTLRPSTPYQVMEVVGGVCGIGLTVWGYFILTTNAAIPDAPVDLGRPLMGLVMIVVGLGWALGSVTRLRSTILATPDRLLVRSGFSPADTFAWSDVASVGIQEVKPSGWRFGALLPWSTAPAGLSWQTTFDEVTPFITLVDGRQVVCTPLVTQARSEGMSFGEPTVAEIKAGLLARYHAACLGIAPTYVPEPARK